MVIEKMISVQSSSFRLQRKTIPLKKGRFSPGWALESSRWFAALGTPPDQCPIPFRARMGAGRFV
jgi:hypothetical protein